MKKSILTIAAVTFATVLGLAAGGANNQPAHAAPAPAAPTILFTEDFENTGGANVVNLTTYTGVGGMTYTADPFYLETRNCNGFVISQNTAVADIDTTQYCLNTSLTFSQSDFNRVLAKANQLGKLTDNDNNHALSSNTSANVNGDGNSGNMSVMLAFAKPLVLDSNLDSRFIAFSVDAAETGCAVTHKYITMQFYIKTIDIEQPLGGLIQPCLDPSFIHVSDPLGNTTFTAAYGSFYTSNSVLISGNTIDLILKNNSYIGSNDGAIDNIRISDVTPTLAKVFAPAQVKVGDSTTLTFTITNTAELGAKNGWSFTDNLPAGLSVAPVPNQ